MGKSPIKVAAAQSLITADVRANGSEIRRLMVEARAAGAGLIHFAEAAMSGCSKAQVKDWGLVDWTALAEELRRTTALARELRLWAVVGSAHPLTAPNRPHNSLYVISDRGELVTRYDKRLCSHTEITGWHTPGRSPRVFEVGGWKFGCILCIEVHFPELFQDYAAHGADCILFSAYADDPMFGIQAQGYAASHSMWISLSIPTQTSGALTSRLIGPNGEIQASASAACCCIAVDLLDETDLRWDVALHRARPWRSRAREGRIYREHQAADDPRSLDLAAF